MGTSQLGQQLNPNEVKAITSFLVALTGQQPRVEYPIVPRRTENTPKPE